MRDISRPCHNLIFIIFTRREDGHGQYHIIQVSDAAVVGIVDDKNIARGNVTSFKLIQRTKFLDELLDALIEHAHKRRYARPRASQFAMLIGDTGPHVEHFVDDGAHGRATHGREHFVGGGLD